MKYVVFIIVSFCPFFGFARDANVFTGPWRVSGAKTLFPTPLGHVYEIMPSSDWMSGELIILKGLGHGKGCKCQLCIGSDIHSLLQLPFLKRKQQNKSVVTIDFKARAFPALSSSKTVDFDFRLVRSEFTHIDSFKDLNGIVKIYSDRAWWFNSIYPADKRKMEINNTFPLFNPALEPISVRVIFDTKSGYVSISHNGFMSYGVVEQIERKHPIHIRNFGIFTVLKEKNHRNQYLELSPPVIRQYDSLKEAEAEKPFLFSPYNYGQYFLISQKASKRYAWDWKKTALKSKNPDFKYVAARRCLYGNEQDCDPELAIKLLKQAIREKHITAMYQLGVCYFRGYGVEKDPNKALSHLKDAIDYEYPDAIALDWFVRWDVAGRPRFNTQKHIERYRKNMDENFGSFGSRSHDVQFLDLLVFLSSGSSNTLSPKYSPWGDYYASMFWKNKTKSLSFIDYCIDIGYPPAYAAKARNLRLAPVERLRLLETGIKAGDHAVIPRMLYLKACLNQLSPKDITPERDFMFADSVLYQTVAFAITHGKQHGLAEIFSRVRPPVKFLPPSQDTPEANFLAGLTALLQLEFFNFPLNYIQKNLSQIAGDGFSSLLRAAQQGVVPAQYLIAHYALRDDLPPNVVQRSEILNPRKMLESASGKGHLRASILLAELEMKNNRFGEALQALRVPCEKGLAIAFHLRGVVLWKARRTTEAKKAFEKAATMGYNPSRQMLACHYASSKSAPELRKLWFSFIQADLKKRLYDIYDPYYPDVYKELNHWKRIPVPPELQSSKGKKKVKGVAMETWTIGKAGKAGSKRYNISHK